MNWDLIEGKWKELKGQVRSKWAKLTDDDLEAVAGKKDELIGRVQQRPSPITTRTTTKPALPRKVWGYVG